MDQYSIQHKPVHHHMETRHTQFDYEAADRGNPLEAELTGAGSVDHVHAAIELFNSILFWVWQKDGESIRQPRIAFIRFVVACALIKPELLGDYSYHELGNRIGCTKANLSLLAKDFENEFHMRFSRSHRSSMGKTKNKRRHGAAKGLGNPGGD